MAIAASLVGSQLLKSTSSEQFLCSIRSQKKPRTVSKREFTRALLATSAAAALAVLRRKAAYHPVTAKRTMKETSTRAPTAIPVKRIDGHLHVWANPEEVSQYPFFPGQEPTINADCNSLLQSFTDADVDGALIVQPIVHMFDHSYVSSVIQKYPDKFIGCCLADPSPDGSGIGELEHLVVQDGYRAVRFNPYLWPARELMTNQVGREMFKKAGELGVVVSFMCFKGFSLHATEIRSLCTDFPETTVLIDHFGFCSPPMTIEENSTWTELLSLASFPQVYVKVSAFFCISREQFPYRDTWPLLQQLLDTYHSNRLLWGSDFPYIENECGYANSAKILPMACKEGYISEEDLSWVMGRTAQELFQGAWSN